MRWRRVRRLVRASWEEGGQAPGAQRQQLLAGFGWFLEEIENEVWEVVAQDDEGEDDPIVGEDVAAISRPCVRARCAAAPLPRVRRFGRASLRKRRRPG